MQIQKVQNTQNFGMALKIDPKANSALATKSEAYLSKVHKIGEQMKGYTHSDVLIKENGQVVIKPQGDKYGFSEITAPNYPILGILDVAGKHENPGMVASYRIQFNSQKEAEDIFQKLSDPMVTDIEKAKALADGLERKFGAQAVEDAVSTEKINKVNEIIGNFS